MNKNWIIIIGVAAIGILAFILLSKPTEQKVTTQQSSSTSDETNGLLGALSGSLGGIVTGIGGLFGGNKGDDNNTES